MEEIMSLINCPECGKEISDKVKACPHCGFPFEVVSEDGERMQKVEISSVKLQPLNSAKSKKIIIGIVSIIAVAVIAVGAYSLIKAQQHKETFNEYVDKLEEIRLLMLVGASKAESMNNLTAKVWMNSIHEDSDSETDKFTKDSRGWFHDDFNIALSALYFDSNTQEIISEIEDNQEIVQEKMKEFQNPPEGLENCYQTLTEMFSAYRSLTDLAVNPTGSLQSFSTEKNERVDKFLELFNRIETQIPGKK
jgi:uncharacterized OB-fold protein